MEGAERSGRSCWWCGVEHTGKLAYEWGGTYPTWLWPDPPPRDHDHAVIPPTADELALSGAQAAERMTANVNADDLIAHADPLGVAQARLAQCSNALAVADQILHDSRQLVTEVRQLRVDTTPLRNLFDTQPARD